jgi:RNA polymerase sigma-70 factor (ECF subfamily)
MNENETIAAVLAGDVEAYSELVRLHQARVRLVCLALLHNPSEADDAAQEAFLKAYRSLPSFKHQASFGTWISQIAANHCRDLLRKTQRQKTDSLDALIERHGDEFAAFLGTESGAEQDNDANRRLLGQVFASLDAEDREILLLRELQDLSYEQIASNLRCSLDAVKGRLKRARQRLNAAFGRFLDTSQQIPRP